MSELNSIALRVRSLRDEKKISNRKFAELLGVSNTMLLDIEKGKRDINLKVLEALKSEFDVSADWVLFGEKSKNTDDLKSLINDFNKTDNINLILHTHIATWSKLLVLYAVKNTQYEFADVLKAKVSEADKYSNKIDRLEGIVNSTIANYAISPSSELADKIKLSVTNYFNAMYEAIYFVNRLHFDSNFVDKFGYDCLEDIICSTEDHLNAFTIDIEKQTEELLKNRM